MIPEAIRAFAEVVITGDGVAHRPAWSKTVVGTASRWDSDLGKMIEYPIHGVSFRPACERIPEADADQAPSKIRHLSAGWAHHMGHEGCPRCWPRRR